MRDIDKIQFIDCDSGDEGFAYIRVVKDTVALCLSLKNNGDLEVFLKLEKIEEMITSLQKAVSIARK